MTFDETFKNPFDALEISRDLVRRDEAMHLFDVIRQFQKNVQDDSNGWYDPEYTDDGAYRRGVVRGLEIVLNELDERVGYLRDRWG